MGADKKDQEKAAAKPEAMIATTASQSSAQSGNVVNPPVAAVSNNERPIYYQFENFTPPQSVDLHGSLRRQRAHIDEKLKQLGVDEVKVGTEYEFGLSENFDLTEHQKHNAIEEVNQLRQRVRDHVTQMPDKEESARRLQAIEKFTASELLMYELHDLDQRTAGKLEPLFGTGRGDNSYYDGVRVLEVKVRPLPSEDSTILKHIFLDTLHEKAAAYGLELNAPPEIHVSVSAWEKGKNLFDPLHPEYKTKAAKIFDGIMQAATQAGDVNKNQGAGSALRPSRGQFFRLTGEGECARLELRMGGHFMAWKDPESFIEYTVKPGVAYGLEHSTAAGFDFAKRAELKRTGDDLKLTLHTLQGATLMEESPGVYRFVIPNNYLDHKLALSGRTEIANDLGLPYVDPYNKSIRDERNGVGNAEIKTVFANAKLIQAQDGQWHLSFPKTITNSFGTEFQVDHVKISDKILCGGVVDTAVRAGYPPIETHPERLLFGEPDFPIFDVKNGYFTPEAREAIDALMQKNNPNYAKWRETTPLPTVERVVHFPPIALQPSLPNEIVQDVPGIPTAETKETAPQASAALKHQSPNALTFPTHTASIPFVLGRSVLQLIGENPEVGWVSSKVAEAKAIKSFPALMCRSTTDGMLHSYGFLTCTGLLVRNVDTGETSGFHIFAGQPDTAALQELGKRPGKKYAVFLKGGSSIDPKDFLDGDGMETLRKYIPDVIIGDTLKVTDRPTWEMLFDNSNGRMLIASKGEHGEHFSIAHGNSFHHFEPVAEVRVFEPFKDITSTLQRVVKPEAAQRTTLRKRFTKPFAKPAAPDAIDQFRAMDFELAAFTEQIIRVSSGERIALIDKALDYIKQNLPPDTPKDKAITELIESVKVASEPFLRQATFLVDVDANNHVFIRPETPSYPLRIALGINDSQNPDLHIDDLDHIQALQKKGIKVQLAPATQAVLVSAIDQEVTNGRLTLNFPDAYGKDDNNPCNAVGRILNMLGVDFEVAEPIEDHSPNVVVRIENYQTMPTLAEVVRTLEGKKVAPTAAPRTRTANPQSLVAQTVPPLLPQAQKQQAPSPQGAANIPNYRAQILSDHVVVEFNGNNPPRITNFLNLSSDVPELSFSAHTPGDHFFVPAHSLKDAGSIGELLLEYRSQSNPNLVSKATHTLASLEAKLTAASEQVHRMQAAMKTDNIFAPPLSPEQARDEFEKVIARSNLQWNTTAGIMFQQAIQNPDLQFVMLPRTNVNDYADDFSGEECSANASTKGFRGKNLIYVTAGNAPNEVARTLIEEGLHQGTAELYTSGNKAVPYTSSADPRRKLLVEALRRDFRIIRKGQRRVNEGMLGLEAYRSSAYGTAGQPETVVHTYHAEAHVKVLREQFMGENGSDTSDCEGINQFIRQVIDPDVRAWQAASQRGEHFSPAQLPPVTISSLFSQRPLPDVNNDYPFPGLDPVRHSISDASMEAAERNLRQAFQANAGLREPRVGVSIEDANTILAWAAENARRALTYENPGALTQRMRNTDIEAQVAVYEPLKGAFPDGAIQAADLSGASLRILPATDQTHNVVVVQMPIRTEQAVENRIFLIDPTFRQHCLPDRCAREGRASQQGILDPGYYLTGTPEGRNLADHLLRDGYVEFSRADAQRYLGAFLDSENFRRQHNGMPALQEAVSANNASDFLNLQSAKYPYNRDFVLRHWRERGLDKVGVHLQTPYTRQQSQRPQAEPPLSHDINIDRIIDLLGRKVDGNEVAPSYEDLGRLAAYVQSKITAGPDGALSIVAEDNDARLGRAFKALLMQVEGAGNGQKIVVPTAIAERLSQLTALVSPERTEGSDSPTQEPFRFFADNQAHAEEIARHILTHDRHASPVIHKVQNGQWCVDIEGATKSITDNGSKILNDARRIVSGETTTAEKSLPPPAGEQTISSEPNSSLIAEVAKPAANTQRKKQQYYSISDGLGQHGRTGVADPNMRRGAPRIPNVGSLDPAAGLRGTDGITFIPARETRLEEFRKSLGSGVKSSEPSPSPDVKVRTVNIAAPAMPTPAPSAPVTDTVQALTSDKPTAQPNAAPGVGTLTTVRPNVPSPLAAIEAVLPEQIPNGSITANQPGHQAYATGTTQMPQTNAVVTNISLPTTQGEALAPPAQTNSPSAARKAIHTPEPVPNAADTNTPAPSATTAAAMVTPEAGDKAAIIPDEVIPRRGLTIAAYKALMDQERQRAAASATLPAIQGGLKPIVEMTEAEATRAAEAARVRTIRGGMGINAAFGLENLWKMGSSYGADDVEGMARAGGHLTLNAAGLADGLAQLRNVSSGLVVSKAIIPLAATNELAHGMTESYKLAATGLKDEAREQLVQSSVSSLSMLGGAGASVAMGAGLVGGTGIGLVAMGAGWATAKGINYAGNSMDHYLYNESDTRFTKPDYQTNQHLVSLLQRRLQDSSKTAPGIRDEVFDAEGKLRFTPTALERMEREIDAELTRSGLAKDKNSSIAWDFARGKPTATAFEMVAAGNPLFSMAIPSVREYANNDLKALHREKDALSNNHIATSAKAEWEAVIATQSMACLAEMAGGSVSVEEKLSRLRPRHLDRNGDGVLDGADQTLIRERLQEKLGAKYGKIATDNFFALLAGQQNLYFDGTSVQRAEQMLDTISPLPRGQVMQLAGLESKMPNDISKVEVKLQLGKCAVNGQHYDVIVEGLASMQADGHAYLIPKALLLKDEQGHEQRLTQKPSDLGGDTASFGLPIALKQASIQHYGAMGEQTYTTQDGAIEGASVRIDQWNGPKAEKIRAKAFDMVKALFNLPDAPSMLVVSGDRPTKGNPQSQKALAEWIMNRLHPENIDPVGVGLFAPPHFIAAPPQPPTPSKGQ